MRMRYVAYLLVLDSIILYWYIFRVEATQLQSTSLKHALPCTVDGYLVEPSGVQALKNPNPLKDVEASIVLDVVVLV